MDDRAATRGVLSGLKAGATTSGAGEGSTMTKTAVTI